MRQLSTAFIEAKNKLEGGNPWAQLVELSINANTTAYFTSHPETLTWNSNVYMPIPMRISAEEQRADGSLPRIQIDVANPVGAVFTFVRRNDIVLRDVIIRLINTQLTNSGDDTRIKMQVLGTAFVDEQASFTLGHNFNFDAEGPLRVYNRRDHPMMPINFRSYAILS